jgi:transcriptional regulator with XRE-family HTH domain
MTSQRQSGADAPAEPFSEGLARAIRELRRERGIDRKTLAARAGISYTYLSEIENGLKRPSSKVLLMLSRGLGVPAHELLGRAEGLAGPQGLPADPVTADGDGHTPAQLRYGDERAPLGRSRFFHSAPAARETASGEQPASARQIGDAQPRSTAPNLPGVINELREHLEQLSGDDVERVLDLARRLRR